MSALARARSHLMGFFYRTLRMVENDLKPCYVFDGKPPALKADVVSSGPTSRFAFSTRPGPARTSISR